MQTRIADDYQSINLRLAEIEAERAAHIAAQPIELEAEPYLAPVIDWGNWGYGTPVT